MGTTPKAHYRDYLHSPQWMARRHAALHRADYRCQVCGADRWFSRLEVHHRAYDRVGREDDADLIVLCEHCHDLFHRHGKLRG